MRVLLLILLTGAMVLGVRCGAKESKNASGKKTPGKAAGTDSVKPDTHAWVIPFMTVKDVGKSLEFYKKVFGFETAYAHPDKKGRIVHAEMKYNNRIVLLLTPEGMHSKTVKTPKASKIEPATLVFVYIKNVDAVYKKALAHGAKSVHAPRTVPWGERHCHILDPDGHRWQLAEVIKKKK